MPVQQELDHSWPTVYAVNSLQRGSREVAKGLAAAFAEVSLPASPLFVEKGAVFLRPQFAARRASKALMESLLSVRLTTQAGFSRFAHP